MTTTQPTSSPPSKFHAPLTQPLPTPIPRRSGYGSIQPPNHIPPSHVAITLPPSIHKPNPIPAKPASGPLAHVPSYPSLVPFIKLDLDAVAEQVSRSVGAQLTASQMLESLADTPTPRTQPAPVHPVPSLLHDPMDILSPETDACTTHAVPSTPDLHVELLNNEQTGFVDEPIVLKIKQKQDDDCKKVSSLSNAYFEKVAHAADKSPLSAAAGFAINIPVQKTPASDPFTDAALSPWQHYTGRSASMGMFDEEAPLVDRQLGVDMSHTSPFQKSVLVQRKGARDIAGEQEVLCAVPGGEDIVSKTTGLLLPVLDSKEDLRQLMLVVPPENDKVQIDGKSIKDAAQLETESRVRFGSVEKFRSRLPPIAAVDSKLEAHGSAMNATVAMQVTKKVSWVGYAVLLVALLSVASQGIAVKWLPSVDGLVSATWLMQAQTLFLIPFALFDYLNLSREEHENFRDVSTRWQIVTASLAQVFWSSGFFFAIDHTSLFHAWSLNNSHALLIVLGTLLGSATRKRDSVLVSAGEIMGAEIALFGVLLMIVPPLLTGNLHVVGGDLVAIAGSIGAIVFLERCKALRKKIPLFLMMAPITALNALFLSFGSMLVSGSDFSMTDHGALGWLNGDRLALGLYMGGVSGFLGMVSCIAALKYLPSVVVGSVQTMMPVTGTLVAVLAGFDKLPDIWSTTGGVIMLCGVLTIANASRESKVKVVINQHIQDSGNN